MPRKISVHVVTTTGDVVWYVQGDWQGKNMFWKEKAGLAMRAPEKKTTILPPFNAQP